MDPKKWPVAEAYSADFHAPSVESISGALTPIQSPDTCLAGSSRHKESPVSEKWEVGFVFLPPPEEGGGGRTVGVNPIQLRDFNTWKLLFHINSQAKKSSGTPFFSALQSDTTRQGRRRRADRSKPGLTHHPRAGLESLRHLAIHPVTTERPRVPPQS